MKLVVMNGEMAGLEFLLSPGIARLGRRSDNDVCLPLDPKISRRHAQITLYDDRLILEDLGSANGTFLGQRRLHTATPLLIGDRFRLGRTWLEVRPVSTLSAESDAARQVVFVDSDSTAEGGPPVAERSNVVYSLDASGPQVQPADGEDLQRRLQVLLDFGQAVGSLLELPQLLSEAGDRLMEVLPAEQVSLLLVDAESGEIVPRVVRSRSGELPAQELHISRNMVTWALDQRLALLTTDASTDERFQAADSVQHLHIHSAICAPMVSHGTALGAIYLYAASDSHIFTQADLHLVAGIASATAIAIENARLYTDLRGAYDSLQAAQDQLLKSERVATIGVLSASIAHDMANIVSPLHPLIGMLLDGKELNEVGRGIIRRQTERLTTLVEQLLSFSRTKPTELKPTDLASVVEAAVSLVNTELVHRSIELELELADDLPPVDADSAQMERAILNLIINAAEALEGRGDGWIAVSTRLEDNEVLLSVADNGPGIPVEVQPRLFEPFFTTKSSGTGLGLYSTRRIIEEEHQGTLELDSREGEGTTITLRLNPSKSTASAEV
jgi:signal transduction histidine kinase